MASLGWAKYYQVVVFFLCVSCAMFNWVATTLIVSHIDLWMPYLSPHTHWLTDLCISLSSYTLADLCISLSSYTLAHWLVYLSLLIHTGSLTCVSLSPHTHWLTDLCISLSSYTLAHWLVHLSLLIHTGWLSCASLSPHTYTDWLVYLSLLIHTGSLTSTLTFNFLILFFNKNHFLLVFLSLKSITDRRSQKLYFFNIYNVFPQQNHFLNLCP